MLVCESVLFTLSILQTLSDHEVDRRRELLFGRLSMQHLRKQQSHHSHDNDTMSMTLAHSGFEGWSESAGRGDWELVNSEGPHRSRLRLVCRRGFQPNAEAPLSTTCISSCSSYRSGSGGTESSWTPSPGPGPSPPALILPGDAIEHQTLAEQVSCGRSVMRECFSDLLCDHRWKEWTRDQCSVASPPEIYFT